MVAVQLLMPFGGFARHKQINAIAKTVDIIAIVIELECVDVCGEFRIQTHVVSRIFMRIMIIAMGFGNCKTPTVPMKKARVVAA